VVSSRVFDQKGNLMARYEHSIDVNVPLETAYNQWTQFEEFPKFMEGVKRVEQQGDTKLHWVAEIAGQERQWEAEISEQKPDARIAWHSTTGAKNAGVVTFHYIDRDTTRVMLQIEYDPEGFVENVGAALGIVQRRISGDLQRFKDFIEAKGFETGAWRGEVERFSSDEKPIIGGGSRYSESSASLETRIPTTPTFYDATSNGSEDASSNSSVQRISKESRSFMGQDSKLAGVEQDPGYGKSEERGQRGVLGDDTFISSGEGDGTNNGGGGISSTERSGMHSTYGGDAGGPAQDESGKTVSATGSDPRLYSEDISHGVAPGEDPMHSAGAVETERPEETWDEDSVRNPPASH
jgi:uncharacterized membrane protein